MSSAEAVCDYEIARTIKYGADWSTCGDEEAEEIQDSDLRIEIQLAEEMVSRMEIEDDEDAPAFDRETLARAVGFLNAQSAEIRRMYGSFPPVPNIAPGPNMSVDLHWKTTNWELLVNIPASREKLATFYGDNYGTQRVKGSFDLTAFNYGIISWMMKN